MTDHFQKQLALFSLLSLVCAGVLLVTTIYDYTQPPPAKLLSIDYRHLLCRSAVNFSVITLAASLLYFSLIRDLLTSAKPIHLTCMWLLIVIGCGGSLIVHYFSMVGWCCENPFAVFLGFPYSWLRAYPPEPYHFEMARMHIDFNQMRWEFQPFAFVIDIIFWANSGMLLWIAPTIIRFQWRRFRPRI